MNIVENQPQDPLIEDDEFLLSLQNLFKDDLELFREVVIPCRENHNYADELNTWNKIQLSFLRGNITRIEFESWIASQTGIETSLPSVIETLLKLQDLGSLFDTNTVTLLVPKGNGVIELNHHLQISIFTLVAFDNETLRELADIIGKFPTDPNAEVLGSKDGAQIKKLISKMLKLKLKSQRKDAVKTMRKELPNCTISDQLDESLLEPHEMDRLCTCISDISQQHGGLQGAFGKAALLFGAHMNPKTVSELAAYLQFAICEIHKAITFTMENTKLSRADARKKATDFLSNNLEDMRNTYKAFEKIVIENSMVGRSQIEAGLEGAELIEAIKEARVKFGANHSAAYHIAKHKVRQVKDYLRMAHEVIDYCDEKNPPRVNLNQEGDARFITFGPTEKGTVLVLEKSGSLILMTYMPELCR